MKRKILVVDDEKHMQNLLQKALETEDISVATASDGQEALNYVYKFDVDLVITDISMPKMQGTDLFFKIRNLNPFIQIILITAYPSLDHIAKMLEGGASDFIVKPFEMENLIKIVNETFSRIDRWRDLRKEWLKYKKLQNG